MGTRQNEPAQGGSARAGSAGQTAQGGTGEQGRTGPQGERSGQSMSRARSQGGMSRPSSFGTSGPFSLMRRISEDMDRLFEGFLGPSMLANAGVLGGTGSLLRGQQQLFGGGGWPEIEVHQEGQRLVVQADLPGLNRDDVHVEVREGHVLISGERRTQHEQNEGGFYHSERSYGSFSRAIPLPENAKVDSASASFENGVLRIEIEAPEQEQSRARRIEIREGKPQ
jgi:HSP20 family protein